jgi:hypothetical protein
MDIIIHHKQQQEGWVSRKDMVDIDLRRRILGMFFFVLGERKEGREGRNGGMGGWDRGIWADYFLGVEVNIVMPY